MKSVLIMMSAYNGELYIAEQLNSLISQEDVDIHIFIRDDGSTDKTVEIIKSYADKYKFIEYETGQNLGYAKSFWTLFDKSNEYDYYAFCDQDDIWKKNKLAKAVEQLELSDNNVPLLYTSDVISVNNNLDVLSEHTFNVHGTINFYQSLQKSILPGCTFVFNKAAFSIISEYKGYLESHDWAVYCIVSAFGKVCFDKSSYIYYRLHGNNAIGKKNFIKELYIKIRRFFRKSKCTRSKFAKDFYNTYKKILDNKEYLAAAYELGYYNSSCGRIRLLKNQNFKGLIFKILILLKRV